MSEEYISGTIEKYLDDLAAKKPAPGGGSVGAFAGALSAGLISMVANFSIGKNLPNEKRIKEILKESEDLREKMSAFIDDDVRVYEEVSSVFKLPKESEGLPASKQAGRKEKIQEALKKAAEIPFEIAQLGVNIMQLNEELFPICNPRLISDIGVSISLAYSSVEIGALNVEINLAGIRDEDFNKNHRVKLKNFIETSRQIKNKIYPEVEKKISKE
jgi:formiminotetrahydrofolate cyclodeaminase